MQARSFQEIDAASERASVGTNVKLLAAEIRLTPRRVRLGTRPGAMRGPRHA
jgi:hypothetical protein